MSKAKENLTEEQMAEQTAVQVTPEQASEQAVAKEQEEIKSMNVYAKLLYVQKNCKAPKGQYNSFGKYSYRTAEDIMAAIKPLLWKVNATVYISDKPVIMQGVNGNFIKTEVTFVDCNTGDKIVTEVSVKEGSPKGNMSESQNTGATISYARKYALNGMFLLDDAKDDADAQGGYQNNSGYDNSGYQNNGGYQNNSGYNNGGYNQGGYNQGNYQQNNGYGYNG